MYRVLLLISIALLWLAGCDQAPSDTADGAAADSLATVEAQADRGEVPLVVYRRSGEAEGEVLEWRIYSSGRGAAITDPGADVDGGDAQLTEVDVDQQAITQLIDNLQSAGFFEVATSGEAECCNQNSYALTVQQNGEVSSMALEAVTPQTSQPRLMSITHVEKFIFDEITSAAQ